MVGYSWLGMMARIKYQLQLRNLSLFDVEYEINTKDAFESHVGLSLGMVIFSLTTR